MFSVPKPPLRTFTLNSPPSLFAAWLEDLVRSRFAGETLPTERGVVHVQGRLERRAIPGGERLGVAGLWVSVQDEVVPLGPLAEFDVVPLAAERCQVRTRATGIIIDDRGLFDAILRAVAETWPESRPGRDAAPAVEQERPTPVSSDDAAVTRMPKRGADLAKWRAAWLVLRPLRAKADSYEAMSTALGKSAGHLSFSADTCAKIVRAGEAGLLD